MHAASVWDRVFFFFLFLCVWKWKFVIVRFYVYDYNMIYVAGLFLLSLQLPVICLYHLHINKPLNDLTIDTL